MKKSLKIALVKLNERHFTEKMIHSQNSRYFTTTTTTTTTTTITVLRLFVWD